jgi:hypothetical protein
VYLEIPVFVHFSFGSHVCAKKDTQNNNNNNKKLEHPVLL